MNRMHDHSIPSAQLPVAEPVRRLPVYIVAVLLLPIIVLWHQDNSLFTPPYRGDSWMYFGFFRSLHDFKAEIFPNLYYGSRLSWILPGHLLHSFFHPVIAAAVLHIAVQVTANLSLFWIVRLTVGDRVALLTTLLFAVSPQFADATGWDYVDGPCIAYLLFSMACLTQAATRPHTRRWLALAGVGWAAMVYANLFWIAIGLLVLPYYLALVWYWHGPLTFRSILAAYLWFGAGFLTLTLVFSIINYTLDGSIWFYAPSVSFTSHFGDTNPNYHSIWTAYGLVGWLWFPFLATATAAGAILRWLWRGRNRKEFPLVLFSMLMLAAFSFLAVLQQLRKPVLALDYYADELLPFEFLVLGAFFWQPASAMRRRTFAGVCAAAAIAFALIWYDDAGRLLPHWPRAVVPAAIAGGILLAVAVGLRYRPAGVVAALAGFIVFTSEMRYVPVHSLTETEPVPASRHAYRDNYERIAKLRQRIESVRKGRMVRFWYNTRDSNSDSMALNASYLERYSWLSVDFPRFPCNLTMLDDVLVVVLSTEDHAMATASGALSGCLQPGGFKAIPAGEEAATAGGSRYTMDLLVVQRNTADWKPLAVATDAAGELRLQDATPGTQPTIPLQSWQTLSSSVGSATLRNTGRGFEAAAPKWKYGYIILSPNMTAPFSGRFLFTMKYEPEQGEFAFGVPMENLSNWRVSDVRGRHSGGAWERSVSISLKQGETFRLGVSSYNASDRRTSLLIYEVQALRLDLATTGALKTQ